jgi:hypothetical protein
MISSSSPSLLSPLPFAVLHHDTNSLWFLAFTIILHHRIGPIEAGTQGFAKYALSLSLKHPFPCPTSSQAVSE